MRLQHSIFPKEFWRGAEDGRREVGEQDSTTWLPFYGFRISEVFYARCNRNSYANRITVVKKKSICQDCFPTRKKHLELTARGSDTHMAYITSYILGMHKLLEKKKLIIDVQTTLLIRLSDKYKK